MMFAPIKIVFPLFAVALLCASCDSDTATFPSAIRDFYTAYTSGNGTILSITTDEGVTYPVLEDDTNKKLTPDSVYRFLGYYEPLAEGTRQGIHLYSAHEVLSSYPFPSDYYREGIKTDPVQMQSIWAAPQYLNMTLGIKNSGGIHVCSFVEDSIIWNDQRMHLYVTLYHDATDDALAFTDAAGASMPLGRYLEQSSGALTVHFSINTYDEGFINYEFNY